MTRYADQIVGTLGCWDRVILTGTLTDVCHAGAVEGWLRRDNIRCFDLKVFAEPLRDAVRDHAILTARAAGLSIQYLERRNFRKEDRVAEVLPKRGDAPDLVHVFSAMEACPAFKPWHDKTTGQTGLRPTAGKCLHYYFYFLHPRLGLVYVRVPTWLPFRLQVYFNGHNWLASRLRRAGLKFQMADNALVECADWKKAQALADDFSLDQLKRDLDGLARQCVPALLERFRGGYHRSLMQVEYALDLVWRSAEKLAPVYEELSRQAIFTVKAPEVAKFLGKRFPANTDTALGSDFHTRVEGTRVKHFLGPASLKLYDKRGRVLRREGTVNDATFFSHHRKVEHRDGPPTYEVAPLQKSIFSLRDLRGLMHAAGARYLAWLSRLEDRSSGKVDLDKLSRPAKDAAARSWRGFNLFLNADLQGILAVLAGEHQISGLTSRRLQRLLPQWTRGQIGRLRRHCAQNVGIHHMIQSGGLSLRIPADPRIAGLDRVNRIAQTKETNQLAVAIVENQKPQPATITFGNGNAPVEAGVAKQFGLESIRLNLNQPRFDVLGINLVARGDKRQQEVFMLSQSGFGQGNSFFYSVFVPLADASLVPPLPKADTIAFDSESLREEGTPNC